MRKCTTKKAEHKHTQDDVHSTAPEAPHRNPVMAPVAVVVLDHWTVTVCGSTRAALSTGASSGAAESRALRERA